MMISKKEACELARDLYTGRRELTEDDKRDLLRYFAPAPSRKKPKSAAEWVALAVGKNDRRKYLNYLYSDGKSLIASDGHRVHWARTDLAKGYYCPRSLVPMPDQGKFPDFERVIPPGFVRVAIEYENLVAGIIDGKTPVSYLRVPGSTAVDEAYLADAHPEALYHRPVLGVGGRSKWGQFWIQGLRLGR